MSDTPKPKNPRYRHKGGKLYDMDVEISEKEATATLMRNRDRITSNAKAADAADKDYAGKDGPQKMIRAMSELANKRMSEENAELEAAIASLKGKK